MWTPGRNILHSPSQHSCEPRTSRFLELPCPLWRHCRNGFPVSHLTDFLNRQLRGDNDRSTDTITFLSSLWKSCNFVMSQNIFSLFCNLSSPTAWVLVWRGSKWEGLWEGPGARPRQSESNAYLCHLFLGHPLERKAGGSAVGRLTVGLLPLFTSHQFVTSSSFVLEGLVPFRTSHLGPTLWHVRAQLARPQDGAKRASAETSLSLL